MEVRVLSSALFSRHMNRTLLWAVAIVSLVLPGTVRAMTIKDFAKMNTDDEATYTTLLVEGTAKMYKDQGKPELGQKATDLFRDTSAAGGVNQLAINLRTMNTRNELNNTNPNNRAVLLTFEHALAQTLGHAGITVTVAQLQAIGRDFRPIGPPRGFGKPRSTPPGPQ